MTILDQPAEKSERKRISLFEIGAWMAFVVIIAAYEFIQYSVSDPTKLWIARITLLGFELILAFGYLVGYYWLDKPPIGDGRAVFLSVLYGAAYFFFTISCGILTLNETKDSSSMAIAGAICFCLAFVLDLVSLKNDVRITSKSTFIRLAVFAGALIILNILHRS